MSNSPKQSPKKDPVQKKKRIKVAFWLILILTNILLIYGVIFPVFDASEESDGIYLAFYIIFASFVAFSRKFWYYWSEATRLRAEHKAKRIEAKSSVKESKSDLDDLDDDDWDNDDWDEDEDDLDGELKENEPESSNHQSEDNSSIANYFLARASVKVILQTQSTSAALLFRHVPFSKYSDAIAMVEHLTRLRILGQPDLENNRSINRRNARLFLACVSEAEYCTTLITMSSDELAVFEFNLPREEWELIQDEDDWQQKESGLSHQDYQMRKVDGMDGRDFEAWCADLLCKNGFVNVNVTPASNDQGVDIIATKDGVPYAIQCKRYSSDLGNTPIQEVFAGKQMYDCQVAAVMTNQHFTSGAKALASKTGVLLWDRDELIHLISCDASSLSSPIK